MVLSHVYSWPEVRRGGERYLHELGYALASRGHRVTILSTGGASGRGEVLGVPVTRFRRRRLPRRYLAGQAEEVMFGLQGAVWALPRRLGVWHALGTADAAAASVLGRAKGFRSVHTSLGIPDKAWWSDRPDKALHELVVKRVDSYICLSEAAASGLRAGWGRDGDVLGGGVDVGRFVPQRTRHARPALLYSGTLSDERKGLRLLLEAVAVLRKGYPDVELWLSGPGDPSRFIEAAPVEARDAAVELGLGTEEEQATRYGRAWVTVLPSKHEAFGLSLVESLACGTPIVALADGGGPAEIVRPGVGSLSGSTPAELAEACAAAIELARLPDTVDACRAISEQHDWQRAVAPRIERIYRS